MSSSPVRGLTQLQRIVVDSAQLQNQQLALTAEQRHYLSRVLRMVEGDRFIAMDGQGSAWLAQLILPNESLTEFQAQILEAITTHTELPIAVTLIAALPKGSGFDEVVRQCTEIGVTCIAPVLSDRTLLNPSPQKLERWRRIAQEAAEQSERQVVPLILDPLPLVKALQQLGMGGNEGAKYFCEARASANHLLARLLRQFSPEQVQLPQSIVIVVGPEGGWTEAEVEAAIAAGYELVSLGPRILRAVTAPLVAVSLIAAVWDGPITAA